MSFFYNIVNFIKDFFFSMFFSSGEDFKNQKALRGLAAEVKKINYPIYRSDKTILAGLPTIIYELYQAVRPLYILVKETIGSNDIRISSAFLDSIVEENFTEEQKEFLESLSFNKRCEKINNFMRADFDFQLKEQNKAFNDFLFFLTDPKFKGLNETINKIFAFFDFCQFKFNDFFAHFDESFKPLAGTDTVKDSYSFQGAPAADVLQYILDIDYLIRNIIIDEELIKGLSFLNAKRGEHNKIEDASIKKYLVNFSYIIENKLGKKTLCNLIKLIKSDPEFSDSTKKEAPVQFINEYKKRMTDLFNADSKKIIKLQQDQQMSSLIEKVFNKTAMLPLEFYNEELNSKIQALTNLSLDWVSPLEIITSFTKLFFQPYFEPFLRELIVEGLFEDKGFQKGLAANYYYCESILEKIADFESLMKDRNENSAYAIKSLLGRIELGGDFEKPLAKIIDFLNIRAKDLVQEIGKNYINLYTACVLVAKDAHKSIPEYVSNLRAIIISARNKENFSFFDENMGNFENFIEIVRKFVVVNNQ